MDVLIELFLELLIEGSAEAAKSKKTPKPVRVFVLTCIIGTMLLFYFLAYTAREDRSMMWGFIIFGSIISFFLINLLYEFIKSKNSKSENLSN